MPEFIKYLRRESRFFLFAGSLFALVVGLVTWPIFLYVLDAYDSFVPIREGEALGMVLGVSVLSLVVFLALFIRSWIKKPSSTEVARQVESANPELRDLLNCAVELEDKSGERELTFMEKRVVGWHSSATSFLGFADCRVDHRRLSFGMGYGQQSLAEDF
jgi:hypothetical protein